MSTEVGNLAEQLAAEFLAKQGLKILERNWRNRFCEIDIVARDNSGIVHFVEVKYRRNPDYGHGYEYVTAEKAARLRRAALFWTSQHRIGDDYQIDVVSVDGELGAEPAVSYIPNAIEQ